ncbi:hypothetical protein QT971_06320 [Microcoleus sp. herbarium19]|uniref:hypothetical protein n=1 Tax=Microcoleus sp. herbarium19 TaxID=3055440 RepID=UPI002FD6D327
MITYGLVKQTGPYSKRSRQSYNQDHSDTISPNYPFQGRFGILEPSPLAKRMVVESTTSIKPSLGKGQDEYRKKMLEHSILEKLGAVLLMNNRFGTRSNTEPELTIGDLPTELPGDLSTEMDPPDMIMESPGSEYSPPTPTPLRMPQISQTTQTRSNPPLTINTFTTNIPPPLTFSQENQADDGSVWVQENLSNQVVNLQNTINSLSTNSQVNEQLLVQQIESLQAELEQTRYRGMMVESELKEARLLLVQMEYDAREMIDIKQNEGNQGIENLGIEATEIILNLQQQLRQESTRVQQLITTVTSPVPSTLSTPRFSLLQQAEQSMMLEYDLPTPEAPPSEPPKPPTQPTPPKTTKRKPKVRKSETLLAGKKTSILRNLFELKRSNEILTKRLETLLTLRGGKGKPSQKEKKLQYQFDAQIIRIRNLEKQIV